QLLIDKGEEGVPALKELFINAVSPTVRARAVFALYRTGTAEALELIRTKGLDDADGQVRIAAARSLGLSRDKDAVGRLKQLMLTDAPAVKRQAATALGQIGGKEAVKELLTAADGEE